MSLGNRTETKSEVTSALVPTLTLAQLITLWNDSVNESNLFRKDVIASATPVGAAVTIDFAAVDTRTVTITVSTTVTFTGLENGDVKYLVISKAAANALTFAGATNITLYQAFIDTQSTLIPYEIINKNGAIYVRAMLETIIKGDLADVQAADVYKFPNCKAVSDFVITHGSWQTPTYVNNHSDYTTGDYSGLRYRLLSNGMLQLAGSIQRSSVTSGIIFTLTAGFRPAQSLPIFGRREDDTLVGGFINSSGVVTCLLNSSVGGDHLDFNVIVPLDLTV